ncbi:hypothetical protein TNCV_1638301 [Trichonephila clavipes]|nr:hypothetical protein TNCV_1638301 [Trichonephila clavipes]
MGDNAKHIELIGFDEFLERKDIRRMHWPEKKGLADSKKENMTTKPHSKTVGTQGTIKSEVSDPKRKSADSKIHRIEMSSAALSKIIHKDFKVKNLKFICYY